MSTKRFDVDILYVFPPLPVEWPVQIFLCVETKQNIERNYVTPIGTSTCRIKKEINPSLSFLPINDDKSDDKILSEMTNVLLSLLFVVEEKSKSTNPKAPFLFFPSEDFGSSLRYHVNRGKVSTTRILSFTSFLNHECGDFFDSSDCFRFSFVTKTAVGVTTKLNQQKILTGSVLSF